MKLASLVTGIAVGGLIVIALVVLYFIDLARYQPAAPVYPEMIGQWMAEEPLQWPRYLPAIECSKLRWDQQMVDNPLCVCTDVGWQCKNMRGGTK